MYAYVCVCVCVLYIYIYIYIFIEHDINTDSVQQEKDVRYSALNSVLLFCISKMFLKVMSFFFVRCDVTEFIVCYLEELFQSA